MFTFGANDWGQLGLGTTSTADRPSCIKCKFYSFIIIYICNILLIFSAVIMTIYQLKILLLTIDCGYPRSMFCKKKK